MLAEPEKTALPVAGETALCDAGSKCWRVSLRISLYARKLDMRASHDGRYWEAPHTGRVPSAGREMPAHERRGDQLM